MSNHPNCHFCGTAPTVYTREDGSTYDPGHVNGPHWTGTEYVRVDYCNDCARTRVAKAPRQPRRKQTQVVATDWNMLVAFKQQ